MNSTSEAFGHALYDVRTERSMSQEALADRCRLSQNYISKLERGIQSPTMTVVVKLAKALEVAPSELVRRMEERLPDL